MNEFVVHETKLTPGQVVRGTMGISINELIAAIQENRDGQFDSLYEKEPEEQHVEGNDISTEQGGIHGQQQTL